MPSAQGRSETFLLRTSGFGRTTLATSHRCLRPGRCRLTFHCWWLAASPWPQPLRCWHLSPAVWLLVGRSLSGAPGVLPSWDLNSPPVSGPPLGDDGVDSPEGSGDPSWSRPGAMSHGGRPAGAASAVVFEPGVIEAMEIEDVAIANGWTWIGQAWIWISHLWADIPWGMRPLSWTWKGPLLEAREAELGAGSSIASPVQGARQLLLEDLAYTSQGLSMAPRKESRPDYGSAR